MVTSTYEYVDVTIRKRYSFRAKVCSLWVTEMVDWIFMRIIFKIIERKITLRYEERFTIGVRRPYCNNKT